MTSSVIALPVSVEQMALAIRQMNFTDRKRLIELVPELRREITGILPRTLEQASASVEQLRVEVQQAFASANSSPDEPFFGGLTVGQYLNLPDNQRAQLWDDWAEVDLEAMEERGGLNDAMPVR